MNAKTMRPSLKANYGTGGRKEESTCFRPGWRSQIHFACVADVSRLSARRFPLRFFIASFPLHFHPQSEVSATPVVFFCLGIIKECHTCAQRSALMFDLSYFHTCSSSAQWYFYIFGYYSGDMEKCFFNMFMIPKRCLSEKIWWGD